MANGEFKAGERISGKKDLEKYITQKEQLLLNQRILEEVRIEYFPLEEEADGAIALKLLVHVRDSFNFIIIPQPKYDSNDGFSIVLKARDYNFLGTMSAFRIDLGYKVEDGDQTIGLKLDSDTPFTLFGLEWNFLFNNDFSYTFKEPFYYQNVTGLSVKLPWKETTFTVGFNQYLTLNEENSDDNKDVYNLPDYFEGLYAGTELYVSWKIPTGIEFDDYGEINYTPAISGKINYPYDKLEIPYKPVATLSHSLWFERINWIGNYRQGLSAFIANDYNWYFDRSDAPIRITLDAGLTYHHRFAEFFGISTRLKYRQWWHYSEMFGGYIPYYDAGDVIRGVIDDRIRADFMFSLNLDFPVRIVRFWPSELFNNSKLHFFDFEMHLSPFLDLAILKGPYSNLSYHPEGFKFSPKDMISTTGLELIVFPAFFRSIFIRASVGYNIQNIRENGLKKKWGFFPQWDEIFIGVDHYY